MKKKVSNRCRKKNYLLARVSFLCRQEDTPSKMTLFGGLLSFARGAIWDTTLNACKLSTSGMKLHNRKCHPIFTLWVVPFELLACLIYLLCIRQQITAKPYTKSALYIISSPTFIALYNYSCIMKITFFILSRCSSLNFLRDMIAVKFNIIDFKN